MDYIVYHGSVKSFNYFDVNKINKNETDALYNGFWFSSKEDTSPAWVDSNYIKKCKVTINNPASHSVIKELYNQLYDKGVDISATKVRNELIKMGYDGVIHESIPNINEECLYKNGEYEYTTERGVGYKLIVNTKNNELDLYKHNGVYIISYYDLKDFLSSRTLIIVAFNNEQIEILEEKMVNYK